MLHKWQHSPRPLRTLRSEGILADMKHFFLLTITLLGACAATSRTSADSAAIRAVKAMIAESQVPVPPGPVRVTDYVDWMITGDMSIPASRSFVGEFFARCSDLTLREVPRPVDDGYSTVEGKAECALDGATEPVATRIEFNVQNSWVVSIYPEKMR